MAQIREFSVIFVAMGITLGHVDASALSLITLVGLATFAMSACMITCSNHGDFADQAATILSTRLKKENPDEPEAD